MLLFYTALIKNLDGLQLPSKVIGDIESHRLRNKGGLAFGFTSARIEVETNNRGRALLAALPQPGRAVQRSCRWKRSARRLPRRGPQSIGRVPGCIRRMDSE